ncbi:ABC transporter substrate-binding protein [Actinokineospora terrae]|uniref:Peptide/nickel transport system substrate-binding protein n=1 Tax=Actinokineospora terrae TaxID=155974 RepID=A0A1H9X6E2_9PSEU|nr:ABC transporter substrate-binding protein [Actinokineospora terrae]SES41778.1 peptide/nickel transport system substrate-binding protein [Actinokineospora terrae]
MRGPVERLRLRAGIDLPEPVAAHRHPLAALTRLHARQLFTYRGDAVPGSWQSVAPVADLATAVPSIYNAGLGARGTSYVIHLRPDVYWDTTPARRVTAQDVVRGLKRLCTPFYRSTALPYFLSTIRGMADYRDGHPASLRTAADLAEHANTHDIAGVFALDEQTLVVELDHPAVDVVDVLALPCASPAPVEYDAFLPDSPQARAALRSTGPYRPVFDGGLRFEPNPAWTPESDLARGQRASVITVSPDEPTPHIDLTVEGEPTSTLLGVDYLVLNPRGPLSEHTARLAIADAITRTAHTIIPPGNDGHQATAPAQAGALPAALSLTLAHPDTPHATAVAVGIVADLVAVGLTIVSRPLSPAESHRAVTGQAGDWDILLDSWFPDWGHDNARAFLLPLCHSAHSPAGTGQRRVDELIDAALAALDDPTRSTSALRAAELHALADAVIVPLAFRAPPAPSGQVAALSALGGLPDLTARTPVAAGPVPSPRRISEVSR